jgi:orotidine-5'-phosphate decarboxylase
VKDRLIVALDVSSKEEALTIVNELSGLVGAFKIGLQLFVSAGPDLVRSLVDRGEKIFLDLKFHDIPNTTAKASVEAAKFGVWMFNVHVLGGVEMMRRTVEEVINYCEISNKPKPKIIGVTILTSHTQEDLRTIEIQKELRSCVLKFSKLAESAGLDGVVASAHEAPEIKKITKEDFVIVTPGIRMISATHDDQKRVMTARDAIIAGSDYIVIGRPVLHSKNRRQIVNQILQEMEELQ